MRKGAVLVGVIALAGVFGCAGAANVSTSSGGGGASSSAPAPRKKTEQDKFQGDWTVEAQEASGHKEKERQELKMVFAGDKFFMRMMGIDEPAKTPFLLDPSQNPKAIDFDTGEVIHRCIYAFDNDNKLRICFPVDPAGERPSSFDTKNTNNLVRYLRRDR
jgi:uncharacterized protein (TIGR03067 family)